MPFRNILEEDVNMGVGVNTTERCNRRCPSCFAHHSSNEMTEQTYCKIVSEAVENRFSELYVLGGEHALHPKCIEFLEHAKGKFNLVIFVTNMDAMADEVFCQRVYDTGVTVAGQRHVCDLSPGSVAIEATLTGSKKWAYTSAKGWENVRRIFPSDRICVQCCITKPVVESGSIYEVFREARRNGEEPVMEFTKEGDSFYRGGALDISPSEMMTVLMELQRIDREEFGLNIDLLVPQAYGNTCHMNENSIHFHTDGSAITCVGFPQMSLGNINKTPMDEILRSPLRQIALYQAQWIYGFCRTCEFFNLCTGGCRGSSFDITGCVRASFTYCPHHPQDVSVSSAIPPTCDGCPLQVNGETPYCNPRR